MSLISEIESTFGVMLEVDDVIALDSYSAAVQLLERHGVTADAC
jgi:hypothetical protein